MIPILLGSRWISTKWSALRIVGPIEVTGCQSWYLDNRGVPATWPWTYDRFRQELAAPRLEDYDLIGG